MINASQNVYAGEINSGVITLMGTALTVVTSAAGGSSTTNGVNGLGLASSNNTLGIFNLDGGTLTTPPHHETNRADWEHRRLQLPTAAHFVPMAPPAALHLPLSQGLDAAYVYSGGANIDDTGKTVTIPQPLLAPTGSGVGSITLSGGGGVPCSSRCQHRRRRRLWSDCHRQH